MLHPHLAGISAAAEAAAQAPLHTLSPADARARIAALRRAPAVPRQDVAVRELDVAGVRVREYVPVGVEPTGTAVYAHSGGWVLGDLDAPDAMLREVCAASGLRYWSVDYRLAPEHPHPAGLEDVESVLLRAPAGPVVLHGDSAGGNLVAVLAARHAALVALQVLVYPVTDWDPTRPSFGEPQPTGFLTAEDMAWFWDLYLPEASRRHRADASPLRHPRGSAPPALIVTAQFDPLRDEGVAYVEALRAVGVAVEHHHAADCTHGFVQMVGLLEPADRVVAAIAAREAAVVAKKAGECAADH